MGRTGDGYRYDHAHVSAPLKDRVRNCQHVHEPRIGPDRLTDHSALTLALDRDATEPLSVTDPVRAVPALF
ncbi:hypothetical protein [Streptomyces albipurpureus]|uniref:Endonuclease/exonuclease/phosphatase n=1 Tax=Streptomyces albipurpureus TaxID=2897419 RepID=A0ABT0UWS3_9ACTN|nr:hypothetical protein [Streptomyces sp. CWNU-1]MCM2392910.1 hypothetical protein [Streptomyces sp. CWNU-1]